MLCYCFQARQMLSDKSKCPRYRRIKPSKTLAELVYRLSHRPIRLQSRLQQETSSGLAYDC